jgi:GNAT superfamily N-acetyltransferase
MPLVQASWSDLLPILRENFSIWSAGLSRQHYQEYIWIQSSHPWARKNLRYMVYKSDLADATSVASCKLYGLQFLFHNRIVELYGIGAVYTLAAERGKGFAKKMLAEVIDLAYTDGKAGVYLFSDVGASFYEDLGFEPFYPGDFLIDLEPFSSKAAQIALPENIQISRSVQTIDANLSLHRATPASGLSEELIEDIVRHHSRWLPRQPFGLIQDRQYLSFKFGKEEFLSRHSSLHWPLKTIWRCQLNASQCAYAITEEGKSALRVLAIFGAEPGQKLIWSELINYCLRNRLTKIRGWEGTVSQLGPSFSWRQHFPSAQSKRFSASDFKIKSTERSWGLPMLLTFDDGLQAWWEYFPLPLLELDHF